jgi:hypothetical protein
MRAAARPFAIAAFGEELDPFWILRGETKTETGD